MIYGQDEPMLFPVADLYDSGMMQMYINAAREQYNQNREDMKEFIKTYGDFMSPFSKDIDWVDQQTRGRVNTAMQYMQDNGIDPLRSAEGRAIIQNVINTTDRAGINMRRTNAKLGEEYLTMKAKMIADGTYNDDYEKFMLQKMGLSDFNQFDSSMGMWNRPSPSKYQDIGAVTSDWTKDLQPEDMGLDPTGRYRIYGIPEEKIRKAVDPNIPGFLGTDTGAYAYELARRQLVLEGNPNPTSQEITDRLKGNIYKSANKKRTEKYTEDPYSLDSVRTANDIRAHRANAANDYYYDKLKTNDAVEKEMMLYGADVNGDGKLSKEERAGYSTQVKATGRSRGGSGGGSTKEETNLFTRAYQNQGKYANYKPTDISKHKINVALDDDDQPIVNIQNRQIKYVLTKDQAEQVLHTTRQLNEQEGKRIRRVSGIKGKDGLKYVFEPTANGQMRARTFIENGIPTTHWYIKGNLTVINDDFLNMPKDDMEQLVKNANTEGGEYAEQLNHMRHVSNIPYEMEVVEGE